MPETQNKNNNKKQKWTKRKKNQVKKASYYISITRSQIERYTPGIDDLDNPLASSFFIALLEEAADCRLFICVGYMTTPSSKTTWKTKDSIATITYLGSARLDGDLSRGTPTPTHESCNIAWQIKNFISPLPQYLWSH